jgi:hypothetical protein
MFLALTCTAAFKTCFAYGHGKQTPSRPNQFSREEGEEYLAFCPLSMSLVHNIGFITFPDSSQEVINYWFHFHCHPPAMLELPQTGPSLLPHPPLFTHHDHLHIRVSTKLINMSNH